MQTPDITNSVEIQRLRDQMHDLREMVRCQECDEFIHYSAAEIIMWYREPVLIRCHPCAEKRWSDHDGGKKDGGKEPE